MFTESFEGVSRKFQGCLKEVSRVFHRSFKQDRRAFQVVKGVLRVFERSLKGVPAKCQGCFKEF